MNLMEADSHSLISLYLFIAVLPLLDSSIIAYPLIFHSMFILKFPSLKILSNWGGGGGGIP